MEFAVGLRFCFNSWHYLCLFAAATCVFVYLYAGKDASLWYECHEEVLSASCNTSTRNEPQKLEGGCVLWMDSRSLTLNRSKGAMGTDFEDLGDSPHWMTSRFINRHYADTHQYRFVVSDGKEFEDSSNPRAAAWYKVLFAKQQLQCCCQWVMFLDSDAYFRMGNHALSIKQWLVSIAEEKYFSPLVEFGVNMTSQTWFPEEPLHILDPPGSETRLIGLFPRNGDNLDGYCGGHFPRKVNYFFPQPPEKCIDFINSGVFILRNSSLTHQFLDEWYNDPSNEYLLFHPWEQPRLNVICNKYRNHLILVPFMELTGPHGRQVRHFWTQLKGKPNNMRSRRLQKAAIGLLSYFEALKDK